MQSAYQNRLSGYSISGKSWKMFVAYGLRPGKGICVMKPASFNLYLLADGLLIFRIAVLKISSWLRVFDQAELHTFLQLARNIQKVLDAVLI